MKRRTMFVPVKFLLTFVQRKCPQIISLQSICSDKAGFITGENICIDGGMTRQMIYHNDFSWTLREEGTE